MNENQTMNDKSFIENTIQALVDNPGDVVVNRTLDEQGVLISVRVNARDMGQVVGKQGATAKALRHLLRVIGVKNKSRVSLKIEEPEGKKVEENKTEE